MTTQKHFLDQAALIFKNSKVGSKLTLSSQQQDTLINVIVECDKMARDKIKFGHRFKEFWEKKGVHSPDGEMITFFKDDWIEFAKGGFVKEEGGE